MGSNIDKVAAWGNEWQRAGDWQAHSLAPGRARIYATGYLAFLGSLCSWKPVDGQSIGIDIGAGAGCLAEAFSKHGIKMVATEWSDSGIDLIHKLTPLLETRKVNLLEFHEPGSWDFILCRELYPFTRVNAFTDQREIVSRLIDSLKAGGVLLLVGSDVSWPHCADYKLLIRSFRADRRLMNVTSRYLEVMMRYPRLLKLGALGCWAVNAALWTVMLFGKRYCGWASIYAIGFRKR